MHCIPIFGSVLKEKRSKTVQIDLAYLSSKSGKRTKQKSIPPFWEDVGVKKWSPFLDSGTWSPILRHLDMGNFGNFGQKCPSFGCILKFPKLCILNTPSAIPYSAMPYRAIPYDTMQWHAKLYYYINIFQLIFYPRKNRKQETGKEQYIQHQIQNSFDPIIWMIWIW